MNRLRNVLSAAALLLATVTGPVAAEPITFRLGTVDAPTSHSGVGANAFAEAVARLSKGEMKVDVFHAGQLGPVPEQIRNVLAGAQDMHLLYPEFMTNFIDETRIISAPYVFRSPAHQQAYFKSDLFKPAMEKLAGLGAVILDEDWTWWQLDPRGLISVRPVLTPDDLKGLKLRIWESRTAIETWRGFGADTVVVPRPEMYLAFQQGIIEAGPETIGMAVDQRNVEPAKHWTRTDEYYQIINVMMNRSKFESLTEAQRAILRQAAKEAGEVFRRESERGFAEKRARAETEFKVEIHQPDLAPWRAKAPAIIEALEADGTIPKGLAAEVAKIPAQ